MDISVFTFQYSSAFSAGCAFISACAWSLSATVKVPYSLKDKKGEWVQAPSFDFDEDGKRYNVRETMIKQAHWNRIAAGFSAVAAMFFMVQTFGISGAPV